MRRCGNSRRKGHDVEAKEFGRFIAGMRKEKKMTQAELAEKIHVTDKAVSRWERGLGFPDIQTIEPLAQALGISVLELMRSERQEVFGAAPDVIHGTRDKTCAANVYGLSKAQAGEGEGRGGAGNSVYSEGGGRNAAERR